MTTPLDLVLEFARAEAAGDPYGFRFEPQSYILRTPAGGFRSFGVPWDQAFLDPLQAIRRPGRDPAILAEVGQTLRRLLVPADWRVYEQQLTAAIRERRPVCITIRSAAAELFALPWELLTLEATGESLGALPGVLVRYEWPETETTPVPEGVSGGRLLVAWSAAGGEVPAAEHIAAIMAAASGANFAFDPRYDVLAHVTPTSLAAALENADRSITALHLLCHGSAQRNSCGIVVNGDIPGDPSAFLDPARFQQLIAPYAGSIRLVVLAVCDGGNQGGLGGLLGSAAQRLHRTGISAVVASRYPLSFDGSLRLTEVLYHRLLVDHSPIEEAFVAARTALTSKTQSLDWASVQLYSRAADGSRAFPITVDHHIGPTQDNPPRKTRDVVLDALRRRVNEPRRILRGLARIRLPLSEVFQPPRLRFASPESLDPKVGISAETCSSAGYPEEPFSLASWLSLEPRRRVLTVFGEVGSGKSEALLEQERLLFAAATEVESAPIPWLIEAKRLPAHGSLSATVARRLGLPEAIVTSALADPSLRHIILVDGADELPSTTAVDTLVSDLLMYETVSAVVITTRPMYRFPQLAGDEATLLPWDEPQLQNFLSRCERGYPVEVSNIRRAHCDNPIGLLSNPLAATYCLLVAKEERAKLQSRSWTIGRIIERLFDEYSRDRPPVSAVLSWLQVAPVLQELAYEHLRTSSRLSLHFVRDFLRRRTSHQLDSFTDFLDAELGIFIHVDDGYEFSLRGIAEFLAGCHVMERSEEFTRAAASPWGAEASRHAVTWQHLSCPVSAATLMGRLLDGDENPSHAIAPSLSDVRRVIVAALVASDLCDEVPHAQRLAEALARWLSEEHSTWIADRVASAARAISRRGGTVFHRLLEIAVDAMHPPRLSRGAFFAKCAQDDTLGNADSWLAILLEREPKVRVIAVQRLAQSVNLVSVQSALVQMFFDVASAGPRERVAFQAGLAIRNTPREALDPSIIQYIKRLVQTNIQLPACAAAIALLPTEASLEHLIRALQSGERAGDIPPDVIRDLEASDEGRDALARIWPDRSHHTFVPPSSPEPNSRQPAMSNSAQRAFTHALAPGLHRASQAQIEVFFGSESSRHELLHDLDSLSSSLVRGLVVRVASTFLCERALAALSLRMDRDPELGGALVEIGEQIEKKHGSGSREFQIFPGRGLEGLVFRGDRRATDLYARWLPCSDYAQGHGKGHDSFSPQLFRVSSIRAAVQECITGALEDSGRWPSPTNSCVLRRFSGAWSERHDVWGRLAQAIGSIEVPFEATRWYQVVSVLECMDDAILPVKIREQVVLFLGQILLHHPTEGQNEPFFWHHYIHRVFRFISKHHLETQLAGPLLMLAGVGQEPVCHAVRAHAICTAWPLLPAANQARLSQEISAHFLRSTSVEEIAPEDLQRLVSMAPQAWTSECEKLLAEPGLGQLPFHPEALMAVIAYLPVEARHRAVAAWREIMSGWIFPWIRIRGTTECRPLDEALRMLFDAGLE